MGKEGLLEFFIENGGTIKSVEEKNFSLKFRTLKKTKKHWMLKKLTAASTTPTEKVGGA